MSSSVHAERSGDRVFNTYCLSCHMSGVAGAPVFGDSAEWKLRADKGMEALLSNVMTGMSAMPPKGLCSDCNDNELKNAIQFILDSSIQ